ncbi:helix-turn-helix transcriptional regulator [Sneathiella marina]|uniref:Helix-turn-helix transcriptional regulator n=1 Tax=Sneathiella marina TaxID=2950108 RepID=A0ABY4WE26_9PROT|nr:helix-turn-helix transcriptional regulator [Sneathiella marina]USG62876.1 helix-turn-helix transcriptional regulator [Sneathiella marina]
MTAMAAKQSISEFGQLLKQWRQIQGFSQLDLALAANSSARHVSFIETGRSRPSREMVLRLAEVMDLPLRERNRLLNASGYTGAYAETALDDDGLSQVRRALDHILRQQEPYPAVVMNRCFDVLMINHAGAKMMNMLGLRLGGEAGPPNLLRLTLHGDGLRGVIKDWDRVARHMIERAHRQVRGAGETDPLKKLIAEVLAYPDIPDDWKLENPADDALPILPLAFELGGHTLSWITTIASFGTPQDVTAEEIMVECMFPADGETEAAVLALQDSED